MKKRLIILILFTMLMQLNASAQTLFNDINNCFVSNNSNQLFINFDNIIEMTIDGKTATYSKDQAKMVLNKFFEKNPTYRFKLSNWGTNKNNIYYIGNFIISSNYYTLFIYSKKESNNKEYIQSLKIQKEP